MKRSQRFRLLGAFFATIALASILAACKGQACTGLPAPPPVALLAGNGNVYLNTTNGAYALQASDGAQLWHEPSGSAQGTTENLVYLFGDKTLQAHRSSDHTLIWQHTLEDAHVLVAPEVVTGMVYVLDGESVLALRASDGSQLWRHDMGQALFDLLQVSNGVVFLVTRKVSVSALRASDGSQLWETEIDNINASSLAVDGDLLYVGSRTLIESLQASTGQIHWQKNAEQGFEGAWAAQNGMFYLGAGTALQAFRGQDGTQLWQTVSNAPGISVLTATNDTVYFVTGHVLSAAQASSGTLIWQHTISRLDGGYRHVLVVSEAAVYVGVSSLIRQGVGCDSHYRDGFAVEAVRPNDGSLLWSFQA